MNKKKHFSIAQKSLQNVLVKLADDDFFKDIERLRNKIIKISCDNLSKNEKWEKFFKLLTEIEKIRAEHKLSEPHFVPMVWLILFDKEPEIIDGLYKKTQFKIVPNSWGEEILCIPIYPETTIEDLRDVFPSIKKIQKNIYGEENFKRAKRRTKINRDVTASKLKSLGYSNQKIKEMISTDPKFNKEILIKDDIPKIINKLKKAAKKAKK